MTGEAGSSTGTHPRKTDPRKTGRNYVDIRADFTDVDGPGHIALFYDDNDHQLRVAAAFVDTRLRADEKCLYLADDNTIQRVERVFDSVGIDVEAHVAAENLEIHDASDVYLEDGFDSGQMIQTIEALSTDSVEAGYSGVAVAGENTWSFEAGAAFDDIIDFEADFDACSNALPVSTLCQYNLNRFSEDAIAKALWTHENIIYRQTICKNPHYVPPAEYATTENQRLNASLLLEQIYDLARTRNNIETQAQHLSVLNRVLRHNIGNDLNVILGRLSLLEESDNLDETERDHLSTALRVAERVVDRSDKARYVQRTVSSPRLETVQITETVDTAVVETQESFTDCDINVEYIDSASVIADRHLDAALLELLTNAIIHQPGDSPVVDVIVSQPSPATVWIDVSNDGPPIPEADQQALLEGAETPLNHGSGLGLWLVNWIVDNSSGRLSFPDSDDQCRARIELQTGESN